MKETINFLETAIVEKHCAKKPNSANIINGRNYNYYMRVVDNTGEEFIATFDSELELNQEFEKFKNFFSENKIKYLETTVGDTVIIYACDEIEKVWIEKTTDSDIMSLKIELKSGDVLVAHDSKRTIQKNYKKIKKTLDFYKKK